MYALGIDVGSSSVKVACVNTNDNSIVGECYSPTTELAITSTRSGFAEQSPQLWYEHFLLAYKQLVQQYAVDQSLIVSIGIAYQMHGLVVVDNSGNALCDAIIWCDSRAVDIGKEAYNHNAAYSRFNLLNSPANFTLSKLAWLKAHRSNIYKKIYKIMLPGDYIAYKLTGEITTTPCGLSEMMAWDYRSNAASDVIFDYFGFSHDLLPPVVNNFTDNIPISSNVANLLGLNNKVRVSYRAGDQPNNALGLKVLESGSVAANAGTSGVLYGVADAPVAFDERINQVLHVNNKIGLLLCLNGAGSANAWLKNKLLYNDIANSMSYEDMNKTASSVACGSDGVIVIPFGNGAERIFANKITYAHIMHLDFNVHTQSHVVRAFTEGVAFALVAAIDIMRDLGVMVNTLKASFANMFLSEIFCNTLAAVGNVDLELYNTSGAIAAALGSAIGVKAYTNYDSALANIKCVKEVSKDVYALNKNKLSDNYLRYMQYLTMILKEVS